MGGMSEQSAEYERRLTTALEHVESHGFGDNVDADSIIEEAAWAYLGLVSLGKVTHIDSSGAG